MFVAEKPSLIFARGVEAYPNLRPLSQYLIKMKRIDRDKLGNPHLIRRFSTFDLLVITTFDQLFFLLKTLFIFYTKRGTLTRRSTVQSLILQLEFPGQPV
jgi:hypothetical protein